jgi:O-antigen/teichoic acid export membrane protein
VKEVASLYRKTSINQLIIGSLLLIGVWINLDNIFDLMPNGKNFELGKWVVIIIGFGKLIDMLFGPSSEIIVLSKYYRFNIILIILLAAMVIISNNILIPRYGIEGAAWGSAFALITFNAIKFIFIYIKFGIQPFEWATIKVLIIGAVTLVINALLFNIDNILVDIVFRSAVVTIVFSLLILWTGASADINTVFGNLISYIKRRD